MDVVFDCFRILSAGGHFMRCWRRSATLNLIPGVLLLTALMSCATSSQTVSTAPAVSPAPVETKSLPPQAQATNSANFAGIWQGTLEFSGAKLRVVFKIMRQEDGTLSAVMDSPDQGATGIPVESVTVRDHSVRIEVKVAQGIFEGAIAKDSSTIDGSWKQSGLQLPLLLERIQKEITIERPQDPKKPYPYREEEVSYRNTSAGVTLAGTLTLPASGSPFPAVLLISGSGPEDRNETVFGHHPFWVLADYLTRRGIAVLRVDDRGVGGSTGSSSRSTTEDFAEDVLAGVNFLLNRHEIDSRHIGLIGHSEGGMIAPMAAVRSSDVDFIVLLAAPGLPGDEILYLQAAAIARADGASDEAIAKNRANQERIFAVLKSEADSTTAADELHTILEESVDSSRADDKKSTDDSETAIKMQIEQVLTPWFRFFLRYDPLPTLEKVTCPVLALNGEKDLQVLPEENLSAVRSALKAGANPHFSVKELPGLNHLFQTAGTGAITEYATIEETIAPSALREIGDWIQEEVQRN